MRYALLAGAAVAALTVGASAANAQITVTLSGNDDIIMGWATNSGTNNSQTRPEGIYNRTRLVTRADGKADNGLEYGVKARLRLLGDGTMNFDESYTYVGTEALGRLYLGTKYGVADDLRFVTNNPTFVDGGYDGFYGVFVNSVFSKYMNSDEMYVTGNSDNRILYESPFISGFQAGIAFTPSDNNSGTDINRSKIWTAASNFQSIYEVGAKFDSTKATNLNLGGFSFGASAFYEGGAAKNATVGLHDLSAWTATAAVGFAGINIGGLIFDNGKSGLPKGVSGLHEVDEWSAMGGITYTTGPFSVGYNFQRGVNNYSGSGAVGTIVNSVATSTYGDSGVGTVTTNAHIFDFDYTVAKGLDVGVEYVYMEGKAPAGTGTGTSPTSNIGIIYTAMSF